MKGVKIWYMTLPGCPRWALEVRVPAVNRWEVLQASDRYEREASGVPSPLKK